MAENNIRVLIDTLYKRTGIRATVADLDKLKFRVNASGQVVDSFSGQLADSQNVMKSLGAESRRFRFELLSVMFGAMAVNRAFSRLKDATVGSFTKIMESSGIFGTAIQQLSAEFEFLKFVIGSAINTALTPFLPRIREFFQDTAEFVRNHPKGVFGTIFGGIAAGAIATTVAGGMLFLQALGNVQWVTIAAGATKLATALGKLSMIVAGVTFTIKGILDFKEFETSGDATDLWNGIANLLIGTGLFLPGAGKIVALLGLGLKFAINPEEMFDQFFGAFVPVVKRIMDFGRKFGLQLSHGFKLGVDYDEEVEKANNFKNVLEEQTLSVFGHSNAMNDNSSAIVNNTSNLTNLTATQDMANSSVNDLKVEMGSFEDQISNITGRIQGLAAAIQNATSAQLALNASVRGDD